MFFFDSLHDQMYMMAIEQGDRLLAFFMQKHRPQMSCTSCPDFTFCKSMCKFLDGD